jgi:hypothetical protein
MILIQSSGPKLGKEMRHEDGRRPWYCLWKSMELLVSVLGTLWLGRKGPKKIGASPSPLPCTCQVVYSDKECCFLPSVNLILI